MTHFLCTCSIQIHTYKQSYFKMDKAIKNVHSATGYKIFLLINSMCKLRGTHSITKMEIISFMVFLHFGRPSRIVVNYPIILILQCHFPIHHILNMQQELYEKGPQVDSPSLGTDATDLKIASHIPICFETKFLLWAASGHLSDDFLMKSLVHRLTIHKRNFRQSQESIFAFLKLVFHSTPRNDFYHPLVFLSHII